MLDQVAERDVVLKMSTGSGKTAVGLLMLKSYMAEVARPGVYLCPTRQLVRQVISEAKLLGLKAEAYTGSHPSTGATRGDAVLVATYEKLINARSTFERADVLLRPVAMVLDDAHTGVERARDAFTLVFDSASEVYSFILTRAADSLRQQYPGRAESILQGDPYAIAEVPYWTWLTLLPQVTKKLAEESESDALKFTWGLVRDDLHLMRCIISGSRVEISPEIVNLRRVPAYDDAQHRIYMSATLADDSVLVRELDCDERTARTPIVPPSDRGMGERMVIVPTLFDRRLDRGEVQRWLGRLSKRFNVVVLTPSFAMAQEWEGFGATAAQGDDVELLLQELRDGGTRFAAIPNRYDGIDLPDRVSVAEISYS